MIYFYDIDFIVILFGLVKVYWYGIMYLFGFMVVWWLGCCCIVVGCLLGVNVDGFFDLLFYVMFGVVVGGCVGYMLFYVLGDFLYNLLLLFKVWDGGMSFYGGLLGVLFVVWWWLCRYCLYLFDIIDFMVLLVLLGLGFGCIGNFIGVELWGKYIDGIWGVVFFSGLLVLLNVFDVVMFKVQFVMGVFNQYVCYLLQLYEVLLEGLVMFVVLWVVLVKLCYCYVIVGLFVLMYGIFCFVVEFVCMFDNGVYLVFDWFICGQLLSFLLVVFGLVLLVLLCCVLVLQL